MARWAAYHGVDATTHQSKFDSLSQQGFRISSLSVYGGSGDDRRYAASWIKKPGPPWRAFHGRTGDEYQAIFDQWTQEGFRPTIIAVSGGDPPVSYAGVFEQDGTRVLAKHGLTRDEFFSITDSWSRENNHILGWAAIYGRVHTSHPVVGLPTMSDETRYAGIWEPNSSGVPWRRTVIETGLGFQEEFNNWTGNGGESVAPGGLRLAFVTITGRQVGAGSVVNELHYFGVFRGDSVGPWVAHHGMTPQEYQSRVDQHNDEGLFPAIVQGYGRSSVRYAAIFTEPV